MMVPKIALTFEQLQSAQCQAPNEFALAQAYADLDAQKGSLIELIGWVEQEQSRIRDSANMPAISYGCVSSWRKRVEQIRLAVFTAKSLYP